MKLRGFAGLAAVLLGATTLLTGCGDKTDSSPAPAPVTTKAPVADQSDAPSQDPSEDPSTPADGKTTGGGGGGDFCKLLFAKAGDLKTGQDASKMGHDELQGIADALAELQAAAPAEIKGALGTMHEVYAGAADGKIKTTDEEQMKKVAAASLKYVQYIGEHCPPPAN